MATIITFPTRHQTDSALQALPAAVLSYVLKPQADGRLLAFPDYSRRQGNVIPLRKPRSASVTMLQRRAHADFPRPAA